MRPMPFLKCLAVVSAGLLSACSLRPYYRQVVPPDVAKASAKGANGSEDVMLSLVEPGTGRPIPGARVLLSTSRARFNVTSDANGRIRMPVTPELLGENPLVEVVLPTGVQGYGFQLVKPEPAPPPASEPAPPPASEPAPPPASEPAPPQPRT